MSQLIPISQLALPIPASLSELAWEQAQADRSISATWNVYLNRIATELLTEYVRADFPDLRDRSADNLWQFVNGSGLELNGKRLMLLPSKAIDHSELEIPQEWVDIPALAGDYFLAVQIDPDAELLHCWGYTTHQMLKSKARYDPIDRTYHLDAYHLIADVSGLWVIQQLNPQEVTQTEIAPLPTVEAVRAENLLQRLASVPNPRLEIPFELWGALISNRAWRQQLVALRQGEVDPQTNVTTAVNRLSGWLQNVFASGWQAVEDFWGEDAQLGLAFRQSEAPTSTMRRVKALQLPDRVLFLLLSVAPAADDSLSERLRQRLEIQVQLRSDNLNATLPAGLTLELLSSEDEVMRSVTTRDLDNAIVLPRFRSTLGMEFKLQVRSGEVTLCESFVV
ncbi:DUF1822 family protein [Chamaesiphon minutus]|uniref:DUF1822 domain-containing protein n=1 Tax=Chamaesiphon minutus (strain ATCC 27169 / PCC 6605) TaxID=1173020 RepID=K9UDU3_CHAP6|nr:DUF1822 family protein [Chamaesiphon minutus]AFY93267.1 Protein of unknown function (DUF1822) [Chamaesiphon minutus PCC 6605]